MEKCKYCSEMLTEGSTVCPGCGRDNAEEAVVETAPVEETAPVAEAAPVAATSPAEETAPAEEKKPEAAQIQPGITQVTPGKLALVIAGIVAVIALIAGLLMIGSKPAAENAVSTEASETVAVEETAPAATVPADGNPDDETCKGTYTVTDEEVIANADTVVATIGDFKLTNGQLQAFYWMQVQSFLSSDYGSYMMSYGLLDYTQPLDVQVCAMTGTGTWQQFFLGEALTTWRNYCVLSDQAAKAGMKLTEEEAAALAGIEEDLQAAADYYGIESAQELMKRNIGAGAGMDDYRYFQETLMMGNKFYDAEISKIVVTPEDVEAFFTAHEEEYSQSGITRDGKLVDVRHVLFVPEGGTTDETGATVYTDEEWAACEAQAQNVLNAWTQGEATEESFAQLAADYSQDPGSVNNGGLYEDVQQGQMVEPFDAWCFDEKREYGHYGIVQTSYGYHLMYFVGSTPIWEEYARQDMVAEKTNELMETLVTDYPMEVDYSAITLGYVNMAA